MKIYPLLFLIFIVWSDTINAQTCCPYIDSVRVLPFAPGEKDSVRIALYVTTPNPAKRISVTATVSPGHIELKGCYAILSGATSALPFADTILIGKLPDTSYYIHTTAYYGLDTNDCTGITDSTTRTDSFTMLPLMPVAQQILPDTPTKDDSVRLAVHVITPNPARKISISHSLTGKKVQVSACFAQTSTASATMHFYDTLSLGKLPVGGYLSTVTAYYSTGDTSICDIVVDTTIIANSFTVLPGVSVPEFNRNGIAVYPNPATGEISISLPQGYELKQVLVKDIHGRLLRRYELQSRLDISSLSRGHYFLHIETNKGNMVQRVLKE